MGASEKNAAAYHDGSEGDSWTNPADPELKERRAALQSEGKPKSKTPMVVNASAALVILALGALGASVIGGLCWIVWAAVARAVEGL